MGAGSPAAFTRAISTSGNQEGTSYGLVNTKAFSPSTAACFSEVDPVLPAVMLISDDREYCSSRVSWQQVHYVTHLYA